MYSWLYFVIQQNEIRRFGIRRNVTES